MPRKRGTYRYVLAAEFSNRDGFFAFYEGKVGTTKTKSSERGLPIPSLLLERMKKLGDGEWIFRAQNGAPLNPQNATHRYIRPATRELGIKLGSWHDFRHTLSTRLLTNRYPTKVVSELLGHSGVQTTLKTYDHVETENFRAPLAEMAGQLLSSVSNCPDSQQSVKGN
jgi:integrase